MEHPEESTATKAPVPTGPLRLRNPVQRYAWGSPTAIPELLGDEPDGGPYAELWLGGHASAPSHVHLEDGHLPLPELIRAHPNATLGERVADEYGPRLPYLLKILAASQALSLQVHPRPHAAREGYNRENAAGIALTDPKRIFHDDQHKPELVVALTSFEVMAGFRSPRAILALLDGVAGDLVAQVREQLTADRSEVSMRAAFQTLLAARGEPDVQADLDRTVASLTELLAAGSPYAAAYQTVVDLAEQFPGDSGALAALMMNRATLLPGEALYVPPAEVHAYLSGVGVEIMASSDNVLRAGLTPKHVDAEALVRYASFTPHPPATPNPQTSGDLGNVATYRVPVDEFALTIVSLVADDSAQLPGEGPRVVLCLEGAVEVRCGDEATALARGEAAFVPHAAGELTAHGTGEVVCAWVP